MGLLGDAWDWTTDKAGDAYDWAAGKASDAVDFGKDVVTPSRADLSPLRDVIDKSLGVYDDLNKERKAFRGEYDTTRFDDVYKQQQDVISRLAAAAAGNAPSPAELMMRQAAADNAARSFGLASAFQGRSPGGALRNALQTNATMQGRTNADAGILRAKEMADARAQLVGALSGLNQQQLLQRQIDEERRRMLLTGGIGALGAAGGGAGSLADASARDAAGLNALRGGALDSLSKLVIMSDAREKTDVTPANLDKLADSLEGFAFRYKNQANGEGQRVGVMAQDVAKGGPIGERIVSPGSDGRLRLDTGNAVGAALAMAAEALKRTRSPAGRL